MNAVEARGAAMRFLTLTIPHCGAQNLAFNVETVDHTWRSVRRGSYAKKIADRGGFLGVINVPDITFGRKGSHYHLHTILIADTEANACRLADILKVRYLTALERQGVVPDIPTFDHRAIYDSTGLAEYLTRSWLRRTENGQTPLNILSSALKGSLEAANLFFEVLELFRNKQRGAVHVTLAKRLSCWRIRVIASGHGHPHFRDTLSSQAPENGNIAPVYP